MTLAFWYGIVYFRSCIGEIAIARGARLAFDGLQNGGHDIERGGTDLLYIK